MNTRLARFTKVLLDVMFIVGIGLTVGIPWLFRWFAQWLEVFRHDYILQCILYMVSGVFCLMIVGELRKMFRTVVEENPFVSRNAVSLKRMGKCSFMIALLSLLRLPITPTPATGVVIIVFSIAGLFSIVLCQIFQKAVQYKEENDFTI